jgi:hypothetical protein
MSYTGREVLQAAGGISKEDFEVIAWLTGKQPLRIGGRPLIIAAIPQRWCWQGA